MADSTKRILVVDDNVDAADSLSVLLELNGHDVSVAYAAERALELAEGRRFDVGLLDLGLPGMDGLALGAALLRMQPEVSLIALTGYGQIDDQARTRKAGFRRHLVKPVDIESIEAALREVGHGVPG